MARRSQSGSVALIAQGPIKNVKREAARHGVHPTSCITVGSGGNVQCYAPCNASTNANVDNWYAARTKRSRKPPGTLLYVARCRAPSGALLYGASGRKRGRQRPTRGL